MQIKISASCVRVRHCQSEASKGRIRHGKGKGEAADVVHSWMTWFFEPPFSAESDCGSTKRATSCRLAVGRRSERRRQR